MGIQINKNEKEKVTVMARKQNRPERKYTERIQSKWNALFSKTNIGNLSATIGVLAVGLILLAAVFAPSAKKMMVERGIVKEAHHSHQATCYTTISVLSCGEEENANHIHVQDCYENRFVLTCGKTEEADTTETAGGLSIADDFSGQDSASNSTPGENIEVSKTQNDVEYTEKLAQTVNKYQEEAERLIKKARNAYANQSTKWNTAIIEKTISNTTQNKTETKPQPSQTENQSIIIGGGSSGAVEFNGNPSTSVTTVINPSENSSNNSTGSNTETKTITTFKKGVDLSALFVSWCIKEAEVTTWSLDEDSYVSGNKVSEVEDDLDSILHYAYTEQLPKDRLPMAGELVFVDENVDGVADLVGIITSVKNERVSYLTANIKGEVVEAVETIGEDTIFAYGVLDNTFLNEFEEYYDVSYFAADEEEDPDVDPRVKYLLADFSTDEDPKVKKDSKGGDIITNWVLSVESKDENGQTIWKDVNHSDFEYTGAEKFKLAVDYRLDRSCFPLDGEENPHSLAYVKLPQYLVGIKDMQGANVKFGDFTVGKMYTEEGYARFEFDANALSSVGETILTGSFEAQFVIDLSLMPPDASAGIVGGNLVNYIKNNQDLVAKMGKLEVEKEAVNLYYPGKTGYRNLSGYNNQAYIEYTVTVTAPNDGVTMPDVKIVDKVLAPNNQYVLAYAGVSGSRSTTDSNPNASESRRLNGGAAINDSPGNLYLTKVTDSEDPNFAIPAGGAADPKTDAMVWEIGAMQPHESRTLTYYLILDNYIGYAHPARENNFTNQAEAYSKQYSRDQDDSIYKTKAGVSLTKEVVNGTHRLDSNGDFLIDYRLTVTANSDNSYPMRDLRIYDDYNPSSNIDKNQISYVRNSNGQHDKWIIKKNGVVQNYNDTAKPDGVNVVPNPKIESTHATFYPIDPLNPGETYTLDYTIKINKEGVYGGVQAEKILNNVAQVHDYGVTPVKGTIVGNANNSYSLNATVWERKSNGTPVTDADRTITMKSADDFYSGNGDSWSKVNAPSPTSFEVPSGGLKYQVVVNESTDWNVTGASFHDQLSGAYDGKLIYHFTGWMQVNLYNEELAIEGVQNPSDEQAIAFYESKTPVKTIWLNIDDAATFDVKPADFGVTSGNYAYLLTYYTKVNEGNFSGNFNTTNEFSMSGDVIGPNGSRVPLSGIKVKKTRTTTGNFSYQSIKHPWYYMSPSNQRTDVVNYPNGEMYWLMEVKVQGGKLLKDTLIRDTVGNDSVLKDSALMGVFVGNSISLAEEQQLSDVYPSLDNFRAISGLTTLRHNIDFTSELRGSTLNITLSNDTAVGNGKSLFIAVRTMPQSLPSQTGASVGVYTNKMSVKTPGKDFDPDTSAHQDIVENYSVTKEGQDAYVVSGTEDAPVFAKMDGKGTNPVDTELLKKLWKNYPVGTTGQTVNGSGNFEYTPGASYISWLITINEEKNMEGGFTILDSLPEGVELAYVRTYSTNIPAGRYDNSYTGGSINGSFSLGKLDENEANGSVSLVENYGDSNDIEGSKRNIWTFTGLKQSFDNDGWKLNWVLSKCTGTTNGGNRTLTLYYTKGNQIAIYIPRIFRNGNAGELKFQVVCKVTKDINKQEQADVEFVNNAQLFGGTNLNKSLKRVNAPVALVYPSLSKELAIEDVESGKTDSTLLPFEVEVNPYAEKLSPDPDVNTITLVDEMGASLSFVSSSLVITDLGTNPVTVLDSANYTAEFNDSGDIKVLRITVPDQKHLKIAYDVRLKALPGIPVKVSNNVRWEGQEAADMGSVDYSIEYSTAAKIDEPPKVTVYKVDSENVGLSLAGAEFKISEVSTETTTENGKSTTKIHFQDGEPVLTEKTAKLVEKSGGIYEFSSSTTETLRQLEPDNVYCIEETKAPANYRLGTDKYYFVIAKDYANGYRTYEGAELLDNWYYQTDYNPEVTITIYNTKGLAMVEKDFGANIDEINGAGTYRFGIWSADSVTVTGNVVQKPSIATCKDTTTITYTAEEAKKVAEGEMAPKQARFVNLTPGKDYYIFELDERFEAIVEGKVAKTNGHQYTVTYTATDDMKNADVVPTVGNKVHIGAIDSTEVGKVVVNNATYKLGIEKKFADANGTLLPAGLTGTYTFGLWSSDHTDTAGIPNDLANPDQTVSITWGPEDTEQSKVAEFDGLVKGAKYYIYELSQDGKPILNRNTGLVNGIKFYALYEGEDALQTVPETYNGPNKSITNMAIVSLPDTGGRGTKWFTILGLGLMVLAGVALMWKKCRKLLLFGLVLCLCASLYVLPANAAVTYTVQIQNDSANHEYVAYQIFKGELINADGQISFSTVSWGKNIDGTRFLNALKSDAEFMVSGHNLFESCTTPAEVMERLSLCNKMQLVAQHASECLINGTDVTKVSTGNAGIYQMTFSEAGYYLFLDNVKEGATLSPGDSLSKYMMKVVESVTITPKSQEIPTIEKKVLDNNDSATAQSTFGLGDTKDTMLTSMFGKTWLDAVDHDIEDEVVYRIKVDLPTDGDLNTGAEGGGFNFYKNYKIEIIDTISPGLTLMEASPRIFIGKGNTAAGYREITNETSTADGHDAVITPAGIHKSYTDNVLRFQINNVKAENIGAQGGDSIYIFYKCVLNKNAIVGDGGNPNTVSLKYSNNPTSNTLGETEEDTNIVFTYNFRVNKVDGENRALTGADFRLDKFYASYRVPDPGTGKAVFYDATFQQGKGRIWFDAATKKYFKNKVTNEVVEAATTPGENWEEIPTKIEFDEIGNVWVEEQSKTATGATFMFSGIDDGTYLLTETVTPTNYNSIDPITFQVVSTKAQDPARPELTGLQVTGEGGLVLQGFVVDKTNNSNSITATIQNSKGSRLPSTGGSGTTLIYILGILLVVGAGAALVVKTRMDRK